MTSNTMLNGIMQYILLLSFVSISNIAFGKVYNCQSSTEWPNENSFSATIELSKNNNEFIAKVTGLNLSKEWPLNSSCNSPIEHNLLSGTQKGNQINLSIEDEKECGFVLYLVV